MGGKRGIACTFFGALMGAAGMFAAYEPIKKEVLYAQMRTIPVAPGFAQKERAFSLEVIAQEGVKGAEFYLRDGEVLYELQESNGELVVGDVYHAWVHASHEQRQRLLFTEWSSYTLEQKAAVLKTIGVERLWRDLPPRMRADLTRNFLEGMIHEQFSSFSSYMSALQEVFE